MRSSSRLALFGLLALAARAVCAEHGRISVAPDVTVSSPTIRLGDVATLDGDGVQALASVALGAAPSAGESRTLDGGAILQAIRREVGGLDGITYTIPAMVRVRRAAQEVSEAAVRGIVEAYLGEALGAGAVDAVLRSIELPGPIRIPAGRYRARVIAQPGVPLAGRVRLALEFAVDDRPVRTVWIVADVGVYGPVVMARRPVARGERLAADDLTVDRRDLSQLPPDVVTSVDGLDGVVARRPLAAWTVLRRAELAPPSAVHRGDVVLLVAERGALRITAPGEVREDAGLNQPVRVVNRLSRKELVGRVLDASTVGLDF
jgi:flagella basal body P-ring formation protein FlgA